jgi:hypothetical protein
LAPAPRNTFPFLSLQSQLSDGTDGGPRNERVDAIEQAEHATDTEKAREMSGGGTGLHALQGSESQSCLLGRFVLGEVSRDPPRREAAADFLEKRRIWRIS